MSEDIVTIYQRILDAPDPPCLAQRGHRLTQEGDPKRWALLRSQPQAYVQHRLIDRQECRP